MGAFSPLALILSLVFSIEAISGADVAKAFKDNEVEPDVVSVSPMQLVEVTYPSGVSVNLGNELTPTQVKDKPMLKWDADPNAFYTLLLTDPDAPSRTKATMREYRHWAVVNIPGNAVEMGETVVDYIGSGAPKDTGLHRYVFLVYKQPNGKIQNRETSVSNRYVEKNVPYNV